MKSSLERRNFIKLTATAGGALIAGVYMESFVAGDATAASHTFSPLIQIDTDGWVTLIAKNPEIGQGVKTSLPMILAEELGANWEKVRVVQADFDAKYEEQWAGGSYAIILNWDLMRKAGATVRQVLLNAASVKLGMPVESLRSAGGKVIHDRSGTSLPFEELLEEASKQPLPEVVEFKQLNSLEIVGKATPQIDLHQMVRGDTRYSIDLSLPGMLYATVLKNPFHGGGTGTWDATEAKAVNGVIDVIELDNRAYGGRLLGPNSPNFVNGISVIATSTWAAFKGAENLKVEWDQAASHMENTPGIFSRFHTALGDTTVERRDGDIEVARKEALAQHEAIYEVPFLAHIPMEPMNCTVDFRKDLCEVWAPTQNPEALQKGLVKLFGLRPEQVSIHIPRIGGGFGRRYYADYAMDAALLSKKLGKPVKLTWTREADIRHDWYRPASVQKLSATMDGHGMVTGWRHCLANASRMTSLGREGRPAGTEIDEYTFPAGFVPNLQIEYGHVLSDVPLGQWRGVGPSATAFAVHSFLDELAHKNQMDPINFFLKFLGPERMVPVVGDYELDLARLLAVIKKVRENSGWDTPLAEGRGRGFAARKDSGSFVAEVVTVEVDSKGHLKIVQVDAVVDCGLVVNPSGAQAQVEGGILDGLSAALYGEITIAGGGTEQSNFHDYRCMRLGEAPDIRVEFIKNNLPPRGLGEPPLPPAAPALANAVFAASGKRIRKLPLLKALSDFEKS